VHVGEMKSTNYGKQGRAGYLGQTYDPFVVEQEPQSSSFKVEAFSRNDSISVDRLSDRRSLLTAVDQFQANTEQSEAVDSEVTEPEAAVEEAAAEEPAAEEAAADEDNGGEEEE
ncbi:MAG: DUF1501 domain-containing protein, partial [Planctomycetes bacterium]|nr:DUF1501 domain-containing protein [Planctomycetota bacterium]